MNFNMGDTVFMASYERREKFVTCPDCAGKKQLTVIMGNGDHVLIDCAGCSCGFKPPTGVVRQYDYSVETITRIVTGVKINQSGIEYELDGSNHHWYTGTEKTVFGTKEEAIAHGELEKSAHEAEENKRLMAKTKDHRSWAWNAHYHLNCAKRAEKELEYHRSKANICAAKIKP